MACSLHLDSAMILVAVHLDPITNKPVRWKVQNSWGTDAGKEGFLVMSDEWFTVSDSTRGKT